MEKSPGERALEARLADLLAERSRLDDLIDDARAGLRALRGTARPTGTKSAQIVELLQVRPMTRVEIAQSLGVDDLDRLSRLLDYLARGDKPRIRRRKAHGDWEAMPSSSD